MEKHLVNPTEELLNEQVIIRRIKDITKRCSDVLYDNRNIPFEDIEIITGVMNEFIDSFHNFKEENPVFQ
jgi:hemerythrin-like domain-containing protein